MAGLGFGRVNLCRRFPDLQERGDFKFVLLRLADRLANLGNGLLRLGRLQIRACATMCLGMNTDKLSPGQRCASTSNRNFEGRQGKGGRTHLMSPVMAVAAAVTGQLTDVRQLVS